jgi:putative transposase
MHKIRIGANVLLGDGNFTVVEVGSGAVKLLNADTHDYVTRSLVDLATALPKVNTELAAGDLDELTRPDLEAVTQLAQHIEEMVNGTPRPGTNQLRAVYDPELTNLADRINAKRTELAAIGQETSARTLRRQSERYRQYGSAGLIDKRAQRTDTPLGTADSRVIEALTRVMATEENESTGTIDRLRMRLKAELLRAFPGEAVAIPPRSTLHRYIQILQKGHHTLGSARTRRSAARPPKRLYRRRLSIMPGHEVQIDSSPWDLIVLGDDGKPQRATLTIMIDIATRSIIATGVRLTATKGYDHAQLLARCVVPRELRPSSYSELRQGLPKMPWSEMVDTETVSRLDTARPFSVPARIMMDNGADFRSEVFRSACQQFGIDITESSSYSPTDKAVVERAFRTILTRFAQHLPGFTGGSVETRGSSPEAAPDLLDVFTLSELFEEWVTIVWQNTTQEGLRDPEFPQVQHTPNSMYAAMFDMSGFVPIPLTAGELAVPYVLTDEYWLGSTACQQPTPSSHRNGTRLEMGN